MPVLAIGRDTPIGLFGRANFMHAPFMPFQAFDVSETALLLTSRKSTFKRLLAP
jgi:hypothetical protein